MLYLVSRFIFTFLFVQYYNLEVTVVKTDEIRGLEQFFTPCFLLIGKIFSYKIIINNYRIAH